MTPPSSGPVFAVSDGAHSGNPDFFFLPPMFKSPTTNPNYEPAAFNPNVRPSVEICLLGLPAADGTRECVGPPITRFAPSEVTLNLTDQQYQVNWRTDLSNLNVASFYRIQVLVGTRVLGFADIDPVVKLGTKELQNAQTGEYIPLVDGRTLPIKFRIESGALCAVHNTACTSGTVNLNTGGGIELLGAGEDFKFDIPAGTAATFNGQPVTDVTFNLEVCSGIDVDLPTFGPCLRVSTYFNATGAGALEFSKPILISMCVLNTVYHTLDETRQEGLITLHQQDGTLIRALPHADPNCGSGTIGSRGWSWLRALAERFLAPKSAYAATRSALLHVGAGGETNTVGGSCSPSSPTYAPAPGIFLSTTCPPSSPAVQPSGPQRAALALIEPARTVSDFQFALPAKMDYLNPDDASRTGTPGAVLPTAVKVTDWDGNAVQGARVTFYEPAIEGLPTVLGVAVSNSDGVAQILWPIRAGANTAVASGRGIAAQNNYPGATVKPFMPDISQPSTQQTPVALGIGRITFTAQGVSLGSLSFTLQPTNTPSGESITPAVQIQVLDQNGSPLSETVRVTVGNDPTNPAGCQVLQTTTLAIEGFAFLDNIRVNGMCTGARIAATAGGGSLQYPIIYSNRFDITAPLLSLAVEFTQGTDVSLEGSIPYVATVTNSGTGSLAGVVVQAYIDQGATTRAAGGAVMHDCSATSGDGVVPPGPCSINRVLVASNQNAGTGTLVAGPARARVTVQWAGAIIATVPVSVNIVVPSPIGASHAP